MLVLLFFEQLFQFVLARQNGLVFTCKYLVVVLRQGHFHDSVVFVFTKNNANRLVLVRQFDPTVVIIDIHLHLSDVLMLYLANLQVKQYETAQQTVIEDKVAAEMSLLESLR